MKRPAYRTAAVLLIALGAVHTLLAIPFYRVLSPDAIWFAGAGLSLVFLGCLNLALAMSPAPPVRALCRAANTAGLAFGVLATVAVPQPQAFAGLLLLLAVSAFSFLPHRAA